MLSGFSLALLKLVLAGEELVTVEEEVKMEDGNLQIVKDSGPTPYQTLRKALDAEAFDAVRTAITSAAEGPFAGYEFETAEDFAAV
mmetsp:Transcript_35243/g.81629  ORF Transcript_35243/g.81629 Transcript_35243/m.81629 type:complete len:86 (+) Transcript_35243:376-633(+)